MKNSDIPVRLLNNEKKVIADVECDGCGIEVYHGHTADGNWYCNRCYLEWQERVEKVEASAICECGNGTNYKKTYPNGKSRYICHCCLEVFPAESCPECGELCAVQHTFGGFSGCQQCIEDKQEGEQ